MSLPSKIIRTTGVFFSLRVALLALCVGCGADSVPRARVTINTSSLSQQGIDRVTVQVEPAGITAELLPTATSGIFSAVLDLPAGAQTLTVTAYVGQTQVGRGVAEVTIVAGETADVTVRVIDQTGVQVPPPDAWVIIRSVNASQTEAAVGEVVELTVDAVDPNGDPITYEWSDNCGGTSFGSPNASTTSWTHAAAGPCDIVVRAAAGGASDSATLRITTTAGNGGASITGQFVPHPEIQSILLLNYPRLDLFCEIERSDENANCGTFLSNRGWARGAQVFRVYVTLDATTADDNERTLTFSDDCGGTTVFSGGNRLWQAPRDPAVCLLTATVTNAEGLRDTFSIAVEVGTEATGCIEDIFEVEDYSEVRGGDHNLGTLDPSRSTTLSSLYANDTDYIFFQTPSDATVTVTASEDLELSIYRREINYDDLVITIHPGNTLVASGTGSVSAALQGGQDYYVAVAPANPGACDPTGYDLTFSL